MNRHWEITMSPLAPIYTAPPVLSAKLSLNAQFLIVNVDQQKNENGVAEIQQTMPQAIHISSTDRQWFTDQIPVTWVPYLVIVAPDQRVVAVNVAPDRLRRRLRQHGLLLE